MQLTSALFSVETPAFVYDESEVDRVLGVVESLQATTGCQFLYSIKPLSLAPLLEFMAPRLSGFAASSPFEARLARSVLGDSGYIHFTSPGIRPSDTDELAILCDYVAFNSTTQWMRHADDFRGRVERGLRINPELSFLDDERYDPCRPNSKLGVPVHDVGKVAAKNPSVLEGLTGVLVHSNCESTSFRELELTINCLTETISDFLETASWINLGGGYLLDQGVDLEPLKNAIQGLQDRFGLTVFLEPGAAYVRSAGYIVSTVLDVFDSSDKSVAVLDTSVNHMPEIQEFDFEPDVLGHDDNGAWEYLLAGCTCLAGDLFGEYRFPAPLCVGDRVTFHHAGAYTLPKAHMFNGVNLPSLYVLDMSGELRKIGQYGYQEYALRWGANAGSLVQ